MVGSALGMVLVVAMVGLVLQQRQATRNIDALARIQEGSRFAFELMTRDGRMAGMNPCGTHITANAIRPSPWWADTDAGTVRAFGPKENSAGIIGFGKGSADRINGTAAVVLLGPVTTEDDILRVTGHRAGANRFEMAGVGDLKPNDVIQVCDGTSAALLQVTAIDTTNNWVNYSATGLNCSDLLGEINSSCSYKTAKTFASGASIVRWEPTFWYIGNSPLGSPSLYRARLENKSGALLTIPEEIAPDVRDLQVSVLTRDTTRGNALATTWVAPGSMAGNWVDPAAEVSALQISFTLSPTASTGAPPLQRTLVALVIPRARNP